MTLNTHEMFVYLKQIFLEAIDGEHRHFQIKSSTEQNFSFILINADAEEFEAMKKIREICGGNFHVFGQEVSLDKFSTEKKSGLILSFFSSEQIFLKEDEEISFANKRLGKKFIYYGEHELLSESSFGKLWPSTMKDFFENRFRFEKLLCEGIMRYFAKENRIWNDLADDMIAGSAYSAIPAAQIWECHCRRELIQKHYKTSLKRNNKEPIGHGIFLAQAKRIISENELQKLFGVIPGKVYIGRKKTDIAKQIAEYIYENMDEKKEVRLPHNHTLRIDLDYVMDAVLACINIRRKISVSYKSARSIMQWHDETNRILVARQYDTVDIPKNSCFKKLKMPTNCVRLKTRKQFVEEGEFQHNCVASYINRVNQDYCSIWSMRKEDGTRNTIEIAIRRSKENPNGYFYIKQMRSFANGDVSENEYALIRDFIANQRPIGMASTREEKKIR